VEWRRETGFTLVEMLVVLGVIAALVAMIVPTLGSVRRHQHLSTCALNLKTIGAALRMYRDDWGGFPPDVTEDYHTFLHYPPAGPPRQETVKGLGLYLLCHLYHNGEAPLSVFRAVRSAHTVTITAEQPHGLRVGDLIKVEGTRSQLGSNFAGIFNIASVPGATRLTYSQTGPDDTGSGGTVGRTGAAITATGAVRASGTVTITTAPEHGFRLGDVVVVAGVASAGGSDFNGTFTLSDAPPSATTFTCRQNGLPDDSGGRGSARLMEEVRYTTVSNGYLRDYSFLHCPANLVEEPDFSLIYGELFPGDTGYWPPAYLGNPAGEGSYNSYDWYYRRDRPGWPDQGRRHLRQPYPPDDTVVTWCTGHREAPPRIPAQGLSAQPAPRDMDVVLWADGSVDHIRSRAAQYESRKP